MKAARVVVLVVAVAAGGIAAILAAHNKEPARVAVAPPPPPPLETVDVLVAKSDLSRGQVIENPDIGWQSWPAAAANANFIRKPNRPDAIKEFVGAIVRIALVAGDPIRDPDVVMAKGSGFMAAVLPAGMRAVAIEISAETGAAGFILPDDHVDVVLTHRDKAVEKATGVEKIVSETILKDVRVLAIDQTLDEKSGTKTQLGKTATLEVTQDQAEQLAQSKQVGTLSLTLRSIRDTGNEAEAEMSQNKDRRAPINMVRFGVSTPGLSQ